MSRNPCQESAGVYPQHRLNGSNSIVIHAAVRANFRHGGFRASGLTFEIERAARKESPFLFGCVKKSYCFGRKPSIFVPSFVIASRWKIEPAEIIAPAIAAM